MLHITQKHDVAATLKRAELMRHAHEQGVSNVPKDWVPLGIVPGVMLRDWADRAGVRMDDTHAMYELLERKLTGNEFCKLRGE